MENGLFIPIGDWPFSVPIPVKPRFEREWLEMEKELMTGDRKRPHHLDNLGGMATLSVNQALQENSRLAIIGDPGCGKTTLLSYLALIYARDMGTERAWVKETFDLEEANKLPIFIELRELVPALQSHQGKRIGLATLLSEHRKILALDEVTVPDQFLERFLEEGNAIVLLDGLDEVADPKLRHKIARMVEAFTQRYHKCRFVVTSRIAGYTGQAILGENYHIATVREFLMQDVRQFLTNWHQIISTYESGQFDEQAVSRAQSATKELMGAIEENDRIRELAINPLMLTVIALVHKEEVVLPDRRAELYERAIEVLLYTWEENKGLGEGVELGGQRISPREKRIVLQAVALEMQDKRIREIGLDKLRVIFSRELQRVYSSKKKVVELRERFVQLVEERTGLLVAQNRGIYAFSHLTFQEYLAACAIADAEKDSFSLTLERAGDSWWRETIMLEAGYLSMSGPNRVSRMLKALADLEDDPENPFHNLVLAVNCINDIGDSGVEREVREEILKRLDSAVSAPLDVARHIKWWRKEKAVLKLSIDEWVKRRSEARTALIHGGMGFWSEPWGEPEWITIPAGPFDMGSEDISDDERPIHTLILPEFKIAKVPITNAQYMLFVNDSRYQAPEHWEDGMIPGGLESHPVTYVNFDDALAYCRWLSTKTGKEITLPSEAEWEKAAGWDPKQKKKLIYPWGNEFDQFKLNSKALGLRTTTPVGIFQEGESPYGLLDASGNVWEWTKSIWGKDKVLEFKYPYDPNDGREEVPVGSNKAYRLLRGGSFAHLVDLCRVAFRFKLHGRGNIVGFRVVLLGSSISSSSH